jgi:hypothetical protein
MRLPVNAPTAVILNLIQDLEKATLVVAQQNLLAIITI